MARYNVRDLIGHWVKPRSRAGKMCPHKCCRGYRGHPDNFPVILPRELLRTASERDLIAHYEQHGARDCASCEKVRTQVLGEIDRREDAGKLREAQRRGAEHCKFARRLERQEIIEAEIARAERATNGEMVNRAGVRRGVTVQSLFTGSEARALRYATPELLEHWQRHPRPSAGLMSANPRVVRRARAQSDLGRVEYPGGY